jgi:chorismate mutase
VSDILSHLKAGTRICDADIEDAIEEIERLRAELAAAIKERDALKQRVAELEALSKPVYISHGQRVESIDLRGRLVCAALTRLCADPRYDFPEEAAIAIADRALAAMRKGEA